MNNNQLQQLRQTLEEELRGLQQYNQEEQHVDATELSSVDNHPADAATDLAILTTEMTLIELKEDELEKIQVALDAMDKGTYGHCVVCGDKIPFERLEAIPTALTCVEHVEEIEE